MKSRPILFSGAMVRALLDGSKTQTRRVCKPAANLSEVVGIQDPAEPGQRPLHIPGSGWFGDAEGDVQFFCPYGKRGDQLWVREAWKAHTTFDHLPPRDIPETHVWYMADDGYKAESRYRQGMFMPRWASRITLEITGVRVEQLWAISADDAVAEGCPRVLPRLNSRPDYQEECEDARRATVNGYRNLWESINGPGSWINNPWVWVVTFKVVQS